MIARRRRWEHEHEHRQTAEWQNGLSAGSEARRHQGTSAIRVSPSLKNPAKNGPSVVDWSIVNVIASPSRAKVPLKFPPHELGSKAQENWLPLILYVPKQSMVGVSPRQRAVVEHERMNAYVLRSIG